MLAPWHTRTANSGPQDPPRLEGGPAPLQQTEAEREFSLRARLAHVMVGPDGDELPEIVRKAQEDARCRAALARLGYSKVRAAYAGHKRKGQDTFLSLENQFLWPTMEFVRDWLKAERRRILARLRWPFLGAMLTTIGAGVASIWIMQLWQW